MKSEKTGGVNGQLQLPGTEQSHAIGTPGEDPNKLFPLKRSKPEVFTQGFLYFLYRKFSPSITLLIIHYHLECLM